MPDAAPNPGLAPKPRSRLHWWIILGMAVGAIAGSVTHALHYEAAETAAARSVLGEAVEGLDARARGRLIREQGRQQELETATLAALEEASFVVRTAGGLSEIFLKLLKLIVIPLVFFSLASGMLGLGNASQLGRIGARTFGLYILTTLLATLTGLLLVNLIEPGAYVTVPPPASGGGPEVPGSVWDIIAAMVPDNVIAAAARFDLIGVIFFTLLFGLFLLGIEPRLKAVMADFIEAGSQIMMRMTGFVISLAPVGIASLIAAMVARTGPGVFIDLIAYVLTVLAGLGVHVLVTLPLLIRLFTRRQPYRYLKVMSTALMTAFSTASSSGTLAVTMERAEKGGGVSNRIASFVLPLGATVNMDGTALYEIVSVIFIAQIHHHVDPAFTLTFGQQMLIVFLGLMVSIGAAGIPHAGLVMMVIILEAVNLPVEYTGIIWSVDRVLDMCRTATNVASDSTVALIVAHKEGELAGGEMDGAAGAPGTP